MGPGASLCFGRRIKWDSDRTDKINGDVAHPVLDSGTRRTTNIVLAESVNLSISFQEYVTIFIIFCPISFLFIVIS